MVADFFIIGLPKAGTTALHEILSQSENVALPPFKEGHYWSLDDLNKRPNGPGMVAILKELNDRKDEYEAFYSSKTLDKVYGDISPSYFYFENTLKNIHAANPNAKIILVLREHYNKIQSQYLHLCGEEREILTLEEALAIEQGRIEAGWGDFWLYVWSTVYAERLKTLFRIFPRRQVLILWHEDLTRDMPNAIEKICRHIGIPDFSFKNRKVNVSGIPSVPGLGRLIASRSLASVSRKLIGQDLTSNIKNLVKRFFFRKPNKVQGIKIEAIEEDKLLIDKWNEVEKHW